MLSVGLAQLRVLRRLLGRDTLVLFDDVEHLVAEARRADFILFGVFAEQVAAGGWLLLKVEVEER